MKKFFTAAVVAVSVLSTSLAHAAPVSLNAVPGVTNGVLDLIFNQSNNTGFPDQNMGSLKIEQIGADTRWTLSANWDNRLNSGNPFVFGIDYRMNSGRISQSSLPLFDVVGQVAVKSFGERGVFFNPSNNANRFTDGEKASWIFRNTQIANFMIQDLHVNAVYNGQSVKFGPTAPVPEPETYAMMLAGLMGVGFVARRKKAKQA